MEDEFEAHLHGRPLAFNDAVDASVAKGDIRLAPVATQNAVKLFQYSAGSVVSRKRSGIDTIKVEDIVATGGHGSERLGHELLLPEVRMQLVSGFPTPPVFDEMVELYGANEGFHRHALW